LNVGHDDQGKIVRQTTVERVNNSYDEDIDGDGEDDDDENWEIQQHRLMEERQPSDDDIAASGSEDNDYQPLTCHVTNNFYTHFRW